MKEIEEFDEFIKNGIVLVDFYAEWCVSCKIIEPILNELDAKFKNVKFGKVNAEINHKLTEKLNITSLPNITLFKDGLVIDQFGLISKEQLEEKLDKLNFEKALSEKKVMSAVTKTALYKEKDVKELIKYDGGDVINIEWEGNFERSVIKEIFEDNGVLAKKYGNCIHLEKMDKELEKLIDNYFKKKKKLKEMQ